MSDYTLHFFDGIDTAELEQFMQTVDAAQSGDTVTIDLCNGGGSVFHGIAICDRMALAQASGVRFISNVWGYAASAACLVALSCDDIRMSANSALMYHSAWNASGQVDEGIKIANNAQQTLLSTRISKISARDFEGDDHWVTAPEARELGIIDSVIGNSTPAEDTRDIRVAAKFIYGGQKMDTEKLRAEDVREEEKKDEEKEAKAECSEDEKKDEAKAKAEEDGDIDLMEAIVQRLEGIEQRLSVLESEGKTQEDLDHKEEDEKASASARRKALMQKLNAVCAPMPSVAVKPVAVAETPEEENERFKATYKNFDALMADFIKRK
jgi:ATP-dependent protease ClpP protease subunit